MRGGDNIKSLKISSTVPQKVGKVIIWVLIAFLLLRGIGSVFKKSDSVTAKDVITQYTKESEQKKKTELEAEATAQSFVTEYLTYNGSAGMDDYSNRVKRYLAGNVELTQNFTGDSKARVLSTEVTALKWLSGSQLNIDVKAKVEYTQKIKSDNTSKQEMIDKTTTSDCSLRVPVAVLNEKYAVEDIPAFIPEADKAALKISPYSGKELDEAQSKDVKTTLENFFKTYYSGNSTEISYYLADSNKVVPGLSKRFELQKMDNASVYTDEKTKGIFAIVSLTVKDSVNGQLMPQKYNVQLIKKDGKLYIESFDVRTGNIQ